MLLIPAIDIKNNNCVRLKKGNIKKYNIFSKNSMLVTNKWINFNIKRLHIVDLDGAIKGKPKNLITVKTVLKNIDKEVEIQIGGGIRNEETIDYYFDIGISYVILGTKAITDLNFLENICNKYKGRIIIALDLKNFKIAINGWKKYHNLSVLKFLKNINNYPLESIIYTDVNRDGTLSNLNIDFFFKIFKKSEKNIIISGGLSTLKDIKKIFELQKNNLLGIICGTSIYIGNLEIKNLINKINLFNKFCIS